MIFVKIPLLIFSLFSPIAWSQYTVANCQSVSDRVTHHTCCVYNPDAFDTAPIYFWRNSENDPCTETSHQCTQNSPILKNGKLQGDMSEYCKSFHTKPLFIK